MTIQLFYAFILFGLMSAVPTFASGQQLASLVKAPPSNLAVTAIEQNKKMLVQLGIKQPEKENLKDLFKELQERALIERGKRGGVDSGGGSLLTRSQQVGLLDLFLYNQEAFFKRDLPLKLARTHSLRGFGIARINNFNSEVFLAANLQVNKWKENSPILTQAVLKALKRLPIYYVDYNLGAKDQNYFLPKDSQIENHELTTAALYIKKLGVFLSIKQFETISASNQIALIIHESLRHAQITYELGFTNEQIQMLTATLMREPRSGETLDTYNFIKGKLYERTVDQIHLELKINYHLQILCEVYDSIRPEMSEHSLLNLCHSSIIKIKDLDSYGISRLTKQIMQLRSFIADDVHKCCAVPSRNYDRQHFQEASLDLSNVIDSLLTYTVEMILSQGDDDLFSLRKITHYSSLDTFIDSIDQKGWFSSPYRNSALELRNSLIAHGHLK